MHRLFDLIVGHTCPHYRITQNSEARLDMKMWYEFARNFHEKSCFLFKDWISSDVLKPFSDSA